MNGIVAYYRVSTAKQGRSGLGLEAQRHAIADYLRGSQSKLVGEFTEVESGRKNDRAELQRALAVCRLRGATLVVAKLDRLSRSAAFILNTIADSGAEFVAVDMPQATKLTVTIMAGVAEDEADKISARTKAALAEVKRRPDAPKLGGHPERLTAAGIRKGAKASAALRVQAAANFASDLAPIVIELRRAGARSLRDIARGLNAHAWPTPRGTGEWAPAQVRRVLARMPATA